MCTYWRVSCQKLHLHHFFGFKHVFAFICKWASWQPSGHFVDMQKKYFLFTGSLRFQSCDFQPMKTRHNGLIFIGSLIVSCHWTNVTWLKRFAPSAGVKNLATWFLRPIISRYNFVPRDCSRDLSIYYIKERADVTVAALWRTLGRIHVIFDCKFWVSIHCFTLRVDCNTCIASK